MSQQTISIMSNIPPCDTCGKKITPPLSGLILKLMLSTMKEVGADGERCMRLWKDILETFPKPLLFDVCAPLASKKLG